MDFLKERVLLHETLQDVSQLFHSLRLLSIPFSGNVLPPRQPFHQRMPVRMIMKNNDKTTAPATMVFFQFLGGLNSAQC